MVVKAKDVVRDASVSVAAAPVDSRNSSSPTLRSELVPRAAGAHALEYLARVQDFTAFQEMNDTPRSVVGRAHTGDHYENTESL
jgi:hypothetical protein